MVRHLIYDGIRTRDYKCIVDGSESFNGPERDYESIAVPGRNGELTVDNGRYNNTEILYTLRFTRRKLFEQFRERMLAVTGYHRLEDNKRPDEYRQARLKSLTPTMDGVENRYCTVELVFDAMPQRFLKSGEVAITLSEAAKIHNPWSVSALPLVRVYGTGTVKISGVTLTVTEHSQPYIDIDCELGDAYCNGENLNGNIQCGSANWPVLSPGDNAIELTGPEKIEIYPRWWHL